MIGNYASTACLSIASQKLSDYPINHPLLIDAALEITMAVSLTETHYTVRNSIYWKRSSNATKKRIKEKLNHLAFDAYTSLEEAGKLLNQYVDEVGVTSEVETWKEMMGCLVRASAYMQTENAHEIYRKQLVLPL